LSIRVLVVSGTVQRHRRRSAIAVRRRRRGRHEVGRQHERDVAEQHVARGGGPLGTRRRRARDRQRAVRRRAVHRGHGRHDRLVRCRRRRRRRRRGRQRRRRDGGRHVSAGAAVRPQAGHAAAALLPGGRLGLGDRGHGGSRPRAQPRAAAVCGRHAETRGRKARTTGRQYRSVGEYFYA